MRSEAEWRQVCKKISAGHVPGGNKELVRLSGLEVISMLSDIEAWEEGDTIVDIGCGNGRYAMGLYGYNINYIGIDIIKPCIEFCKMAFEGMRNFEFIHVDVKNGHYWPEGKTSASRVIYSVKSGIADLVIAGSVFSHTGSLKVARHVYSELVRICKPGGLIFSTWYFGKPSADEKKTIYNRSSVSDLFTNILSENNLPPMSDSQIGILCQKI